MVGRSKVWQLSHFVDDDRVEVQCNLCSTRIKYSGNTTNIANHLKAWHSEEFGSVSPTPESQKVAKRLKAGHERKGWENNALSRLLEKQNKELRQVKEKKLVNPDAPPRPKNLPKSKNKKSIFKSTKIETTPILITYPLVDKTNNVEEEVLENSPGCVDSTPSSNRPAGPYLLKKEPHCTTILDELLVDETYADVTLSAEGQNMRAHRIILCLASKYFQEVLSEGILARNVVFFNDVKFQEMKNMVKFMYTGEVTVDATELDSFMRLGEKLQVTSLCEVRKSMNEDLLTNEAQVPTKVSKKRVTTHSEKDPPTKSRKINSGTDVASTSMSSNAAGETYSISYQPSESLDEENVVEGEIIDADTAYIEARTISNTEYRSNVFQPIQAQSFDGMEEFLPTRWDGTRPRNPPESSSTRNQNF